MLGYSPLSNRIIQLIDEMEVQIAVSLLSVCEVYVMNIRHIFQKEEWRAWLNLVHQLSRGKLR